MPGYNITAAASTGYGGFSITGWKDFRKIYWKETADKRWKELDYGGAKLEDADRVYNIDDTGSPELAVLDVRDGDEKLFIFPTPDDAFDLKLYTFDWTSNPASNLLEDELLKRFPEALYTGAIKWAYLVVLKDPSGAAPWLQQWTDEIKKIRSHAFRREWRDTMRLIPRSGSGIITRPQVYETNYTD